MSCIGLFAYHCPIKSNDMNYKKSLTIQILLAFIVIFYAMYLLNFNF